MDEHSSNQGQPQQRRATLKRSHEEEQVGAMRRHNLALQQHILGVVIIGCGVLDPEEVA